MLSRALRSLRLQHESFAATSMAGFNFASIAVDRRVCTISTCACHIRCIRRHSRCHGAWRQRNVDYLLVHDCNFASVISNRQSGCLVAKIASSRITLRRISSSSRGEICENLFRSNWFPITRSIYIARFVRKKSLFSVSSEKECGGEVSRFEVSLFITPCVTIFGKRTKANSRATPMSRRGSSKNDDDSLISGTNEILAIGWESRQVIKNASKQHSILRL